MPAVAAGSMRPRARAKIEACLKAAGHVFREHGFALATMDQVAEAAAVSKATLYAYFPSKLELFAAVIRAECDRQAEALRGVRLDGANLRGSLLRLGEAVLDLLLAEDTITSYRMVLAEAARAPELGRLYYENGAARLHEQLEPFLLAAMKGGQLRQGSAHVAAMQFIGLVRGDLMLRALLGLGHAASAEDRRRAVRSGVDSFCRAWAAVDAAAAVSAAGVRRSGRNRP